MRNLILIMVCLLTQFGLGATPSEPIEPKVKAEIAKLAAFLSDSQSLSFKAEATNVDVSSTLQRLHYDTALRGAMQRPNKFFLEKTGEENETLWFDGSQIVVLDRDENKFIRVPFSGNLEDLVKKLESLKVEAPFGGLLRKDILDHVDAHVFRGDNYPRQTIDGTDCAHLALRQDSVDWQAWIAADGAPKKLLITSKMLTGMPEHQIIFRAMERNKAIEASVFTPVIPKNATEAPVAGTAGGDV